MTLFLDAFTSRCGNPDLLYYDEDGTANLWLEFDDGTHMWATFSTARLSELEEEYYALSDDDRSTMLEDLEFTTYLEASNLYNSTEGPDRLKLVLNIG